MKGEIENAVIPLAEQVKVVLQLLTRVASEMAEFGLHRLRDQLERGQDIEAVLGPLFPEALEAGDISFSSQTHISGPGGEHRAAERS